MTWKRGLIRLWALTSILWVFGIAYASGVFFKHLLFGSDYQYVVQSKETPGNIDWSKPFYETCYAPGHGRFPDEFTTVDDIQEWNTRVKAGQVDRVEFPDYSSLYLPASLTDEDAKYLAKIFWHQRWNRYVYRVLPWLASAFGPPLLVLILGFAIAWVSRGFIERPVS
jgi:hypothetical protein